MAEISLADRWAALASQALGASLLLWAGMVLGVSFLAIPAQFTAESLPRPFAFDVVRQVFTLFMEVQIGITALTVLLACFARPRLIGWLLLAVLWLIVVIQAGMLLPELAARADMILAGENPPPGPWHVMFEGSELAKLLMALAAARLIGWRRAAPEVAAAPER